MEVSQVEHEYNVYKSLAGAIGIPSVHWFGTECDYNVLVLEHLGPSLEDLFDHNNQKFCLPTVLLLADQLVSVSRIMFAVEHCTNCNCSDLVH